ncbi:SDR family oxidoreductase [Plantactinospora sp. B5E13]|uniref:SDR family oxidoreductase n=1 Tax=Plantactinospora sp. B5E13 TaxID=3153758 RepID=UPI00325EE96F
MSSKRILITGAGSGFGEGAAIGLARAGHEVIATTQIYPQVTALRQKAADLGLGNLRVQKLDIRDPYDVEAALKFDIDVLFSNAGIGEAGPVSEIPVDLLRNNFETNVFAPLNLAQKFIRKFIDEGRPGKVVFTSSMGGLFTPAGFGPYVSTKHALESLAEALDGELRPFNIKVQTVNPGAYLTGYNETMAETAFRWLDDSKNFNKRADVQAGFDALIGVPEGQLDPQEMIDAMIRIVPSDTGKFRNVVPAAVEQMLKESQQAAWTHTV